MKHLLWGAFAVCAIACGGGAKKPTDPQPQPRSACADAVDHVADFLISADEVAVDKRPDLVRVMTERCEGDRWSDEAVSCLATIKKADELEPCGHMLTDAQKDAAEAQLKREVLPAEERDMEAPGGGGGGGAGSPKGDGAPPPPPDDPCGGGA